MSGHADLMLGYVTSRDAERIEALRVWRRQAGAIPGPFEVWLAHRSLPTLAIRLERACDNALAIARLLAARADVTGVRYPGLPGDPGHEVAQRQMDGYGMVVSFDLGSEPRAERFLAGRRAGDGRDQLRQRPHGRGAARAAGAATPCPRASSGCRPAARTPPTCSRTSSGRSTPRRAERHGG